MLTVCFVGMVVKSTLPRVQHMPIPRYVCVCVVQGIIPAAALLLVRAGEILGGEQLYNIPALQYYCM